ncbi:MAG: M42 family metallopeptidase [Clostridia bacterium]|nr:M42 family metallopeptidase [Clostridia bacterium]
MLLKELTQLNGVAGCESAVREFIMEKIALYADDITVDTMGNLIAFKKGSGKSGKKIALCAHMDEVGFIVSGITDDGYIKFKPVGGIDERILLSKRVTIGKDKISGVIGIKAVHLSTPEEREAVVKQKDMYIDIGAKDKESAEEVVALGDYIAFDSDYLEFGNGKIKAKAIDDRAGCAILIECMKKDYTNDMYFCFTVQEETGLKGAAIVAHRLQLDAAFIVESTTAADVPGLEEHEYATSLGSGPAITVMDGASNSSKALNNYIFDLANENNIKYQLKRTVFGGNDARAFATRGGACATAAISLPCRYIHSPVCIADMADFELTMSLVQAIAENSWKLGGII